MQEDLVYAVYGVKAVCSAESKPVKDPSSLQWTCCRWLTLFVPSYWWRTKLQAPSEAVPPPVHHTNTASPLCFWYFKPASTAILTSSYANTTHPNPQAHGTYCLTKAALHAVPPGAKQLYKTPHAYQSSYTHARLIYSPCTLMLLILPPHTPINFCLRCFHYITPPSCPTSPSLPQRSHWVHQGPCLECGSAIVHWLPPVQCITLGWLSPWSPVVMSSGFRFL